MISTASGVVVHLFCVWLLYFKLDWGFAAICWATAMMFLTRFLVLFLNIILRDDIKEEYLKMDPPAEYDLSDVNFFSEETISNLGE